MRTYAQKRNVESIEKLVIRSASTEWMAPNKCHAIFFVNWSAQVPRASSPARKMSLFPSFIIRHVQLCYPMQ